VFERKGLPAADEIADEVSGIAGVAHHVDVGAAVRNSDHPARITELARHSLFVDVEQRYHVGELKVVLEREIEKQIRRIGAALARDLANRLPLDGFKGGGIPRFLDLGAVSYIAQDSAPLSNMPAGKLLRLLGRAAACRR
jgi:hypothetical protein